MRCRQCLHLLIYIYCDSLSAGGGCEAVVAARTRYSWVNFRECGELLYAAIFYLRLKGSI